MTGVSTDDVTEMSSDDRRQRTEMSTDNTILSQMTDDRHKHKQLTRGEHGLQTTEVNYLR